MKVAYVDDIDEFKEGIERDLEAKARYREVMRRKHGRSFADEYLDRLEAARKKHRRG